jgi:two-component system, LytTR family, response regulator
MNIRCIAVDDEPLALNIIKEYVSKIPFLQLVKTFDNAIDVISFLKENTTDIIFLDIQMEELTGIQLLKVLRVKPKIIITTAYDSYAISSYELDVTDYLLKPFSFERFFKAVNKSYEIIMLEKGEKIKAEEIVSPGAMEDYFFVKTEFRLQKVNFSDILYIEGQGDYLSIATTQGKIMTLQNFSKIETLLPASKFVRVHKSYIIPIKRIEKIERNRIKIGEKIIPIGDTYREVFFDMLEKRKLM